MKIETKSKRVNLLLQPSVVKQMKLIAVSKGISMNELFNIAAQSYITDYSTKALKAKREQEQPNEQLKAWLRAVQDVVEDDLLRNIPDCTAAESLEDIVLQFKQFI